MVVSLEVEGAVGVVTIDNPPVNAVSHAVRSGLIERIAEAEAMTEIKAVVLICEGRTFVAGADVREFGRASEAPVLPDVVAALEAAKRPWVAALHGTALGGGLELALGCAFRIALSGTKLGLPEVTLGLIPGAGGTVRLPRLVGPVKALEMMASGKPVSAEDAAGMGLIDAVVTGDLRAAALRFAGEIEQAEIKPSLSERPIPDYDAEQLAADSARIKTRARGQNSPLAVVEAVEASLSLPLPEALAAERALFLKLKDDPQSEALRYVFFAERASGKIDRIAGATPRPLERIGVVGGGTMGAGIAAACLLAGLEVRMVERDAESAAKGRDRTLGILDDSLKRGLISRTQRTDMEANFSDGPEYSGLSDVDLAIEAVFEDMDAKRAVFQALEASTQPDCILASNTSYLDIDDIAASIASPERVIGLHFFSPAHVMKLLELVMPQAASPEALATGAALGKRLRKITVPAGICDGFIGNRIMSAYRRAADETLEDGALPQEVDAAMRAFGFAMGIFEVQDLAGLDIAWAMRKRQSATRDPKSRYVAIADRLCEAGRFGRKTGRGWYDYSSGKAQPDPEVEAVILTEADRNGITRRGFTPEAIMDIILKVMQDEARAILAEGIAASPGDIDVVMVNGYGFPRWRGGPMFMADRK